jgi:hypothetical protein
VNGVKIDTRYLSVIVLNIIPKLKISWNGMEIMLLFSVFCLNVRFSFTRIIAFYRNETLPVEPWRYLFDVFNAGIERKIVESPINNIYIYIK